MSVVERIMRQILPLLVVVAGVAFLIELFFVNTSEYVNAPIALILCAIVAPVIQQIGVVLGKSRKRKVILFFLDFVAIVIGFLVLVFGEYVAVDLLRVSTVKYMIDPGTSINTTAALIASVIVIGVAFWPTRVSEKTSVDAT